MVICLVFVLLVIVVFGVFVDVVVLMICDCFDNGFVVIVWENFVVLVVVVLFLVKMGIWWEMLLNGGILNFV